MHLLEALSPGLSHLFGSGCPDSVQTINQLLTEMDGFDANTGVVVMAATNRPAALDNALTRPGRFDRVIHLSLPNLQVLHCALLALAALPATGLQSSMPVLAFESSK